MDLTNQFLVAAPQLRDPLFERSVVYICQHDAEGAMGVIINHPTEAKLSEIFSQLDIFYSHSEHAKKPVYAGGPIHPENGFVLHRPVGEWSSSVAITKQLAITTSKDVLEALADNIGPEEYIITLGYAGWEKGQLEKELSLNDWFIVPADEKIIFDTPVDQRWQAAIEHMGISLAALAPFSGTA